MTAKNAKMALLILACAMSLVALGPQYAVADDGDDDGDGKKETYGTKTEAFDLDKQYDRTPDDVLLDRNDTEWTSQKNNDPAFENKRNAVK